MSETGSLVPILFLASAVAYFFLPKNTKLEIFILNFNYTFCTTPPPTPEIIAILTEPVGNSTENCFLDLPRLPPDRMVRDS